MSKMYTNALGLDLGLKKIGVARVNAVAKIPEPLYLIENNDQLYGILGSMIKEYNIDLLVVGLPRNMSGQETNQTEFTRQLATAIGNELTMPIIFQDETLSTQKAQEYRMRTGSTAPEDAVAACIILADFMEANDLVSDKMNVDV